MSDRMWHFVNQGDVISRTFGLADVSSNFVKNIVRGFIAKKDGLVVDIADEVIEIIFPIFRPVGIWVHLLDGSFRILNSKETNDMDYLKNALSFKRSEKKKQIKLVDFQQHQPNSYLNQCQTLFPEAFNSKRRQRLTESIFLAELNPKADGPFSVHTSWASSSALDLVFKGPLAPLLRIRLQPNGQRKFVDNDLTSSQVLP